MYLIATNTSKFTVVLKSDSLRSKLEQLQKNAILFTNSITNQSI